MKIAIFIMIIIILLAGAGGGYFWWTQKQISALNATLGTKDVQLAEQNQVIEDYKQQLATVQRANTAYNTQLNAIRSKAAQLQDQLNKLNLTTNAAINPRETERQINSRYQQIFTELTQVGKPVNPTGGK
jgi:chromosome segregation ATPase